MLNNLVGTQCTHLLWKVKAIYEKLKMGLKIDRSHSFRAMFQKAEKFSTGHLFKEKEHLTLLGLYFHFISLVYYFNEA